ncbi:NAD-dependent epimerase/dehydratase family protein [Roseibium sp.]|uniref:NAD-dependent epimerase/dehydratase family protein n=1 Tax=Roseibium sp. TaxID=1936156 RepID=UPI0039F12845
MHILVTGASGKLGRRVVRRLLEDRAFCDAKITAATYSRGLDIADDRLQVVKGNLSDRAFVREIMKGVTHVLHMATCKEIPEQIMDVSVKGMFWLLEEFREQNGSYFILIGGDAAVGHAHYGVAEPITENHAHRAYPGCYALSKVLEEVMLSQAHVQYGIEGCCLRAPWLVADDDLRFALSFSDDVFGAPRWCDEVAPELAARYARNQSVPLALAADGRPLRRGLLAVEDLVDAIVQAMIVQPKGCETFNIAMDEPFDYAEAARYLKSAFGLEAIEVQTDLHSVTLDNSKARSLLGWAPKNDTTSLVANAWRFERGTREREEIAYPG